VQPQNERIHTGVALTLSGRVAMDFSNITAENVLMYALKHYSNPACHGMHEFQEDVDRIKYLKRLFRRYLAKGVLKERLILNHLIVIYNVFGPEAGTRILFARLDEDLWPILKTFLVFLDFMPTRIEGIHSKAIISDHIGLDQKLIQRLRAI
jgi:hypothetical protein